MALSSLRPDARTSPLLHQGSDSCCLVSKSYPTLGDTMDRSPPGPSVHGILQARTLEWGATASARGSS